jgi:hypothetical protein
MYRRARVICKRWHAGTRQRSGLSARLRASRQSNLFFAAARPKKSPAASQFCDRDGKRAVSGATARASRA